MNHHIKKVQIKNACHENWGSMSDTQSGKYCKSCQKNVVDFSKMNSKEILTYISEADKLCGKFEPRQLEGLNLMLTADKKVNLFYNWSLAAMLTGLITFVQTEAKAKSNYEQHENFYKKYLKPIDSAYNFKVTGTITDNGIAVPYVDVQVKGTTIQAVTNNAGFFQINVPSTADTLVISTIGYSTQQINVSAVRQTPLDIQLNGNNVLHPQFIWLVGGIYVVRSSLFYRIWYAVKRPFRAIFHS